MTICVYSVRLVACCTPHRSARPDGLLLASMMALHPGWLTFADYDQLEPRNIKHFHEAAQLWISVLRQRPAQRHAVHAGPAGHRRNPSARLGDVAQGQHEGCLIAFRQGGIKVSDGEFGIAQLSEQPLILRNRWQVISSFHNLSSSSE